MATVFPVRQEGSQVFLMELASRIIAGALTLLGIYLAYVCCLWKPLHASPVGRAAPVRAVQKFLFGGWGFDWLYHQLFVRLFLWIARINKGDFIDSLYSGMAALCRVRHFVFRSTESGRMRTLAVGLTVGSLILIALAILL